MKILQVSATFYPALDVGGGVPRVAYELSRQLVKRGNSVTVLTTCKFQKDKSLLNKWVNVEGIQTYYSKIHSNIFSRNKFYITLSLHKIVKEEIQNFDIVHLQDYRTFQNVLTYYYAKKYNIPYIVQAHGSLQTIHGKQNLKTIFDILIGLRILKNASKVIALNRTEAEIYESMGVSVNKIEIFPNGIDLSEISSLPEKGNFKKKYSIDETEKIVLYVGRLHETKGVDLLLEAFSELSKNTKNVVLVYVGPDSGYRSTLERRIQMEELNYKVVFTGIVDEREKREAFVDADVFVTPSFYGFPLTFVEACAYGLPIITTDRGDKLEWIHNKVGYVVPYDKDHLSAAISNILSTDERRKEFGNAGKNFIKTQFNWEAISMNFEHLYSNILNYNLKFKE